MSNKCKECGHLESEHIIKSKGYPCSRRPCKCKKFLTLVVEESPKELVKRFNKADYDKAIWKGDIIRNEYDIRRVPDESLSWYQKMQKRRIKEMEKNT